MPYLKESKADEIWTLNHAYRLGTETIHRVDRHFELHREDWYRRRELADSEDYYRWLQQSHSFPIYMQQPHKDIPASVRFPYEEIVEDIFGKLLRGGELNPYFTSSFSFMLALAIYERFKRVELYGIEMQTGTEWAYQKPGGELMIGVAIGRGIEVELHPKSELCKALIYGYDSVPSVTLVRLKELLGLYQEIFETKNKASAALLEHFNSGGDNLEDVLHATAMAAAYHGAVQVLGRLIKEDSYYVSRQNLEQQRVSYLAAREYYQAQTNAARAAYKETQAPEKWQEHLDARASMYANMGAEQVIGKLMAECDLHIVEPELTLTIQDK